LLTDDATVEALLLTHRAALGRDFTTYRNHVYRVVNFCMALTSPEPEMVEKIAVAAVFHDLGIWTAGTFDYLPPSIRLVSIYLAESGRAAWLPEITAMILEHHKISAYDGKPQWLVEPFRRADWIDVSRGLCTFGLSRAILNPIFAAWPNAGFHTFLLRQTLRRFRTHPLSPLPMMRR
jgi:hypothetical protein